MRDRELWDVLLIKAIEETDFVGEVIPLADRDAVSRDLLREGKSVETQSVLPAGHGALPLRAQHLLLTRARRLLHSLRKRHPFFDAVLDVVDGPRWVSAALLAMSFLLGGAMSALDGSNRIDVLGFPLLLLVLWNFFVYFMLALHVLRSRGRQPKERFFSRLYVWWVSCNAKHLLAHTSRFNEPLTASLRNFVFEWLRVANRLLVDRGTRLFHLCSASAALGLIGGLYVRGIWRGYRVGWDSTWPDLVPWIIRAFYSFASYLTDIALPTSSQLEAMRWSNGSGQGAAPWIHLMAVTALLFIVGPRLALALWTSVRIRRSELSATMPASISGYYRTVLGTDGLPPGRRMIRVIPYSYEPLPEVQETLRKLLPAALGEAMAINTHPLVPPAWKRDS